MGRHDRRRTPGQAIEDARFSNIHRPGNGNHRAVPQPLAATPVIEQRPDFSVQLCCNRHGRRHQVMGHVALVGKIDDRLHQREGRDQPGPPFLGPLTQEARKLPECLAPLGLGLRPDQIGEPFNPGEVELAVLEGAAGEFAGFGGPQFGSPAERFQHRRHHGTAAMKVEFGGILAGFAARAGKPQHQRIVDRLAIGGIATAPASPGAVPASAAPASERGASLRPATRTTAIAAGSRPDDSAKMVDGSMNFTPPGYR